MKVEKHEHGWGYEALLVNRQEYSSRTLVIKEGEQTPYIYHKKRDKCWVILQGAIQYTVEGRTKLVGEGEVLHISPRIMHRATAIKGDATIIEVGTQILDDEVDLSKI